MSRRSVVSHDGAKIVYHFSPGDRPECLIFLHGLGGDLTAWKIQRQHFTQLGFSTLAIDLRGHDSHFT